MALKCCVGWHTFHFNIELLLIVSKEDVQILQVQFIHILLKNKAVLCDMQGRRDKRQKWSPNLKMKQSISRNSHVSLQVGSFKTKFTNSDVVCSCYAVDKDQQQW